MTTWHNGVCKHVSTVGNAVLFQCWHGGFVYRCTLEAWQRGVITDEDML